MLIMLERFYGLLFDEKHLHADRMAAGRVRA